MYAKGQQKRKKGEKKMRESKTEFKSSSHFLFCGSSQQILSQQLTQSRSRQYSLYGEEFQNGERSNKVERGNNEMKPVEG